MILITIFLLIIAISFSDSQFKLNSIYFTRIAALSSFFSSILCFNALFLEACAAAQLGKGISIYCGLFQVSYSNLLIESFIYFIGTLILLSCSQMNTYSITPYIWVMPIDDYKYPSFYLNDISVSQDSKNYSLIALFSMLGSSLLLSSCDLLSMYLSIELQSFSLYILATLYRNYSATSAGLKYFLLGGLSSCIILLGSALIYALTGLTGFDSIYSLISSINIISFDSFPLNNNILYDILEPASNRISKNPDNSNDFITLTNSTYSGVVNDFIINMISLTKDFHLGLSLGLILIFSGLLFKIAAAPFHNWAPDVYDDSPTYVTTWLTILPKISILILLFELFFHMALPTHLEEYNSIYFTLIDLLTQDILSPNITNQFSSNSIPLIDSLNNEQSNLSSLAPCPKGSPVEGWRGGPIYNNLLIEALLLDKHNTLSSVMIDTGAKEVNNIDLLTSLRLNTDILLKNILLFSSLLSLIIGTVLGLSQIKIKRLLAYSTISHVGFLLLCLAVKTEVSIESFIFYLIQYSLTNLNGFLILLAFGLSMNYLIDYKGIPRTFHHYFSNMLTNMINIYNPLNPSLYKYPVEEEEKAKDDQIKKEILENTGGLRFLDGLHLNLKKQIDNSYITPLVPNTDSFNNIKLRNESGEYKADLLFIKELQDQFKFNPALSLSFAITLFSMAGKTKIILFNMPIAIC
jgi:NADH:ubiquinone oxidoreductase subunit 2 (subunit N)